MSSSWSRSAFDLGLDIQRVGFQSRASCPQYSGFVCRATMLGKTWVLGGTVISLPSNSRDAGEPVHFGTKRTGL